MKKLLAIGLLGLSFTSAAFAQGQLELNIDPVELQGLAALPHLSDVKVVVDPGPALAAVQPTVHVEFTYSSCGERDFFLKTLDTPSALLVAVDQKFDVDCAGLPHDIKYSLQLASDLIAKPIIVLNPVASSMPRPQVNPFPPRMCTAEAGILFNPKTGKCKGFTNGCQRNDLESKGYQYPQEGQCGN